jgi:hypothetical protein
MDTSFYTNNKNIKTLVLIHFHEVPKNIDLNIIERVNPNIIFYISNENALNLFYSKKYTDKIIASFPMYHSENLSREFYNVEKTIDLLICGNCSNIIYPLRHRIKTLVKDERLKKYNIYIRPTCNFSEYSVEDVVNSNGEIYKTSLEQTKNYLKQINQSKLVLCTSHSKNELTGVMYSTFRLRKYAEIGMSSALRIGDYSDEDFFNLEKTIIDISTDDDENAIKKIIYYIENNEEREKLIKLQNENEIEFTCTKYIEKILFSLNMYRKNKFGFYSFCNFTLHT